MPFVMQEVARARALLEKFRPEVRLESAAQRALESRGRQRWLGRIRQRGGVGGGAGWQAGRSGRPARVLLLPALGSRGRQRWLGHIRQRGGVGGGAGWWLTLEWCLIAV